MHIEDGWVGCLQSRSMEISEEDGSWGLIDTVHSWSPAAFIIYLMVYSIRTLPAFLSNPTHSPRPLSIVFNGSTVE